MRSVVAVAALTLVAACGGGAAAPAAAHDAGPREASAPEAAASVVDGLASTEAGAEASSAEAGADAGLIAARPYILHVPASYAAATPAPLVVMFHGSGANGYIQESYFGITATSDANGFLYAYGDGTLDATNSRFWNADDACCDFGGIPVDDVAYFDAIVADVRSKYSVDPKRVFVIGHSNGGFMSHRLACDRASTVAAIVSLAGAVWNDPSKCAPTEAVSIAEVHGDADQTISYTGGTLPTGTYPGAATTVATWAAKDACTGAIAATGKTLTLDTTLPPNQTVVSAYAGCPAGVDVQLWTVQGGGHIPTLPTPGWGDAVWAFLSAHPKR